MKKLNKNEKIQSKTSAPEERKWTKETIIIGILAKKYGINGKIDIKIDKNDYPNSLGINMMNDKLFIYAE